MFRNFLKNFKRIIRNRAHLLFQILTPSLLVAVIVISLGRGPSNLNLAIYDEELQTNISERFGQRFVETIDKNVFNIYNFNSLEEAVDSVKSGENHAVIEINDRFTKALRLRFLYWKDTDKDIIKDSQLYVSMDRSNQMIGLQVQRYLYKAMFTFLEETANRSNIDPELLNIPLVFEKPIYGNNEDSLREFVIPGMYLSAIFYVAKMTISHSVYEERRDGLFERNLVSGIKATEFLISYLLTQMNISCIQTLILPLIPYLLLGRQLTGPILVFFTLTLSQGFCGAAFGLMLVSLTNDLTLITLSSWVFFISAMATSGVLWPVETMPKIMQFICKLMPNTIPMQSMRAIIYKEWTIDYSEVYLGFVVTYVWFAFFLIMTLIVWKKIS